MKGYQKLGLGAVVLGGAYGVSQYVGDDESPVKARAEDTAPPEPVAPPAPEVVPPAPTDVESARERARTETAEACSLADKAKIEAAKELVVGLTGQSLSTAYECTSESTKVHDQPVLGLVVSGPGEAPVAKLTPRAFESWVTPEQRGAAVLALNECATTGTCDSYTGPGSHFAPGGDVGDHAEEFIDKAQDAKKTAAAEATKPTTEFTQATVVDAVGKGIYQDTRGGVLEGNFNHGTVIGTYSLRGVKLKGSFTVEDGLAKPKGEITITNRDKSQLTCQFIDGLPDFDQTAKYINSQGAQKDLFAYTGTGEKASWGFNIRESTKGVYEREDYRLKADDFELNITQNTHDSTQK